MTITGTEGKMEIILIFKITLKLTHRKLISVKFSLKTDRICNVVPVTMTFDLGG